jgi:hypothetical protein
MAPSKNKNQHKKRKIKKALNLRSEYESAPLIGIIVIFLFIIKYGGSI